MIEALAWKEDGLELLDQTQLPERTQFLHLRTSPQVFEAIQSLRVRGAPAIGIAAAYGLYLGVRDVTTSSRQEFFRAVDAQVAFLSQARPTAVNLVWALQQLRAQLAALTEADVPTLKGRLLDLARALHEDDRQRCQRMAEHGQRLVPDGARILTHCNTGALATGGIGTALGVIHHAHALGKKLHVYADETRPVLQGARLTMWELAAAGIPAQLICDSAAAWLMRDGKVDLVILGADRIAADGSVANKIGTYSLAVLARHHGVPFYVAAPLSTFDRRLASGREIPIEHRSEEEVRRVFGKTLITLPDAACCNPAFDVTPPELVTAIITEHGILEGPSASRLAAMFAKLDSTA
jgi:methylthioribose-1-phosphate isomerase